MGQRFTRQCGGRRITPLYEVSDNEIDFDDDGEEVENEIVWEDGDETNGYFEHVDYEVEDDGSIRWYEDGDQPGYK